ncbi:hypothetical protein [Rhodopseudomonas sp. B29]|uniref:hypothetical protein n=1 Tax=Rhodopseudomonas sp. B29 TaxID=95607 RepID=UPI0003453F93|nr:hypothetical protein [Rhodopseudomonas sp. B29]
MLIIPAAAQVSAPAAIVEDVKGEVPGVEFMDYVLPGKVIKLGAKGEIVLNYLNSCVRETIKGGVVIVGTEQSKVSLADIQSDKIDCAGPKPMLSDSEASQSAATAFRSIAVSKRSSAAAPVVAVYSVVPLFDVAGKGRLVIERKDIAGERQDIALDRKTLAKGRFADLGKVGKPLAAGGLYAASFGGRHIVFKVAATARRDEGPVIGRLLRF